MEVFTLDLYQRLVLANQFRLLHAMTKDPDYAEKAEIVEHGFIYLYKELTEDLSPEEPMAVATLAIEIMDMFRSIYNATPDDRQRELEFAGFDDRSEEPFYAFTSFVIGDLKRYSEFAEIDLKSTYPMLGRYKRMLTVYRQCANQYKITEAELVPLITAAQEE